MLADAWQTLYTAVREHRLATTGIYARNRNTSLSLATTTYGEALWRPRPVLRGTTAGP